MTFGSQFLPGTGYDPNNPNGEKLPNPKVGQADMGLGINYSSNTGADNKTNYSIGLAAYHLNRPESNFYGDIAGVRQQTRLNLNTSINWLIDETWSAQAQGNFMLQGKYKETILGGLVGRKNDESANENSLIFYAGLLYRVGDAVIPVVKIDYNELTFGMSYDMNVSKLKAASNLRGGFEISIIKTGLLSDPQRGFNKTVCPRR
jgi:type IX secretion system PorP/SprF family membrane protein